MFNSAAGQQESHNHSLKLSTWSLHRAHVPGWGCADVLLLSHCHCVTHNANCEPPPICDMFYLPQDRFLTVQEKYIRDQRRELKKTFINILHL